jgi:hypothetical protein
MVFLTSSLVSVVVEESLAVVLVWGMLVILGEIILLTVTTVFVRLVSSTAHNTYLCVAFTYGGGWLSELRPWLGKSFLSSIESIGLF